MDDIQLTTGRYGKTRAAVEATKAAQRQGKNVLWATHDQAATAQMLARHGALSELVSVDYIRPHFKEGSQGGN